METSSQYAREEWEGTLKPSLEGWKLHFCPFSFSVLYLLETFLRGMETLFLWCGVNIEKGLETFLRGMETRE